MPRLRSKASVLAVLCSDIHATNKTPPAREEKNWILAMRWPLYQVARLCKATKAPLVIAGDLFHSWNEPPESINLMLEMLPERVYAIPGNHDTPNHALSEIGRSAYWTLVESGRIKNIPPGVPIKVNDLLTLYGFPCDMKVTPLRRSQENSHCINLAVVHSYLWSNGYGHAQAKDSDRLYHQSKNLHGYDAACWGDNHHAFLRTLRTAKGRRNGFIPVMNCGCLMRRKIDEIAYIPQIGILYEDGTIQSVPLDCADDKFLTMKDITKVLKGGVDAKELIADLATLGDKSIDFVTQVKRWLRDNEIEKGIQKIVLAALEKKK